MNQWQVNWVELYYYTNIRKGGDNNLTTNVSNDFIIERSNVNSTEEDKGNNLRLGGQTYNVCMITLFSKHIQNMLAKSTKATVWDYC